MSIEQLAETAQAMVAPGKGIIAIDESTGTIGKRFASVGLENTEENRRAYRELLLTTPKLNEHISGAILYDETIRQSTKDGVPFAKYMAAQGIIPGIKVDKGAHALAGCPGELVTEGLDGLRERLQEYYKLGARFAKWRAVINIGESIPSGTCIESNAHALARYAALCQECGLVPMVEPEVIMDGDHDIETCYEVTEATLRSLFADINDPEGLDGHLRQGLRRAGRRRGSGRVDRDVPQEHRAGDSAGRGVPVRWPER
jgi:fructose-bisphosphate aldolase class I